MNPQVSYKPFSLYFFLSNKAVTTILAKSPWDTFRKLLKTIALSVFQPLRLECAPFPLKQCWSVPETFGIIAHKKFFHYPMYFSQKPTLFKGRRGTNVSSGLKICKVSQDFWQVLYISIFNGCRRWKGHLVGELHLRQPLAVIMQYNFNG